MTGKTFKLDFLANAINAELVGAGNFQVNGIAPLDKANGKQLSFLASGKYQKFLADTKAGAVVLKATHASDYAGNKLIVADPYLSYAKLSRLFEPRRKRRVGIHASAVVGNATEIDPTAAISAHCVIGDNVIIGANTEIYPGCVIGDNCKIGADCLLHPNVTLYAEIEIGDRVIIHSGTVIGSDGFGFAPSADGWTKIHQLGAVIVGDDVEIGASTAIDRGALGNTIIEDGVIIDNLVHIAHNVRIGAGTAIAGCVGIAGSATIGRNCTISGAVAINGHVTIADNTHFHGGTIVTSDTKSGSYASIPPVQDVKKWRRNTVRYSQLDEWVDRIKSLEKAIQNKTTEE